MTEDGTQTNETDGTGDKAPITAEKVSDYDKLKEDNDKMEAELVRKQTLRKNMAAEKMIGGDTTSQAQEIKKEETPTEYRDRIDKEISEGKHAD